MLHYTWSEFLTMLKEDIGIKDIPLPVDDNDLTKRLYHSALKEFSVRYPRIQECQLSSANIINRDNIQFNGSATYQIPKDYYQDSEILAVLNIDSATRSGGVSSMYYPSIVSWSADSLISSVADIKMAASMGSMMSHSPTFRFYAPDKLVIYDGWYNSSYCVELALMHDLNLTTIPTTALTNFRQLADLDLKWYLYNKLKRKENLDVGIGNINLKIDDWQDAEQQFRDLLQRWDEEGANLDVDRIQYYN